MTSPNKGVKLLTGVFAAIVGVLVGVIVVGALLWVAVTVWETIL